MGTLFEQLKILFDNELYTNAETLSKLILSMYEVDRTVLTQDEHFSTLVYLAESLYHERVFREAEGYYRQALHVKRLMSKNKPPAATANVGSKVPQYQTPPQQPQSQQQQQQQQGQLGLSSPVVDLHSEVELKFKTAKCLLEIKRYRDAIVILQSLGLKQRTPKVNMLLSQLCHHHGHERSAIGTYKEVLKDCPLAFEAIEGLLTLGMKGIEVNSLIVDVTVAPQCLDWMVNWIKAHAHIHARKYPEAIATLRSIESNTSLRNCHQLLVLIGECYYHNGEYGNAYVYLKRAHGIDPSSRNGIQILAILMAKKKKLIELEKMVAPTWAFPCEYTTEMWFVMAQFLYSSGKYDKAVYFVQKACFLNPKNIEALVLKAEVLMQLKKHQEAISHLRFVQQFAPYRFEVQKALVDTCIDMGRIREAQVQALKAMKLIGESPRMLVFLARTYLKDETTKAKAKSLFLKALELNENYLPAVYFLAELYQQENDISNSMKLLKKNVMVTQNCKLHAMLGDLLVNEKDQTRALEHYTMALNLDPTNRAAMTGLLEMGQGGSGSNVGGTNSTGSGSSSSAAASRTTCSAYVDATMAEDGGELTDNALELIEIRAMGSTEMESEGDAMWSDLEIEFNQ